MNWDINVIAGLVAGIAAMIPGAIIYDPRVLGTAWMKEINHQPGKASPVAAVGKMFITSLINGLVASLIVYTIGAKSIGDAVEVGLPCADRCSHRAGPGPVSVARMLYSRHETVR
jgi:hypothetical protein